jgi:DNA repair photolyase
MSNDDDATKPLKGRGAQLNTPNKFLKQTYVTEHIEGLDEPLLSNERTTYFYEYPKQIVNKVTSPDLPMPYSMNPYQGCEHGCAYCYARNVHTYWGFSAGLDFERKIIIKPDAPQLLEKTFMQKNWKPGTIMLSGNTDCYQPIERKVLLTRKMLEVCLAFKHPVGIITKNSLVLRDKDVLKKLAALNLVHVMVSLTTLDEQLRQVMEPRTATAIKRLQVIEELNAEGIPCGVMTAPTIPGLNSDEIPALLEAAAARGARQAGYTLVRLNGDVKEIFRHWLYLHFPDRADKVWHLIMECHGGDVSDTQFGRRMKGDGNVAQSISQLFKVSVKRYFQNRSMPAYDFTLFQRPERNGQMRLF